MREILFRGKRTDNGKWVEGYLIQNYDREWYICPQLGKVKGPFKKVEFPFMGNVCLYEVIPETVGQFVGEFVTTGEKCCLEWARIFEGDILECVVPEWPETAVEYRSLVEYSVRKGIVSYEKDLGEFRIRLHKNGEYWKREKLWTYGIKRLNIIGNIHDNPELLEVKK